MVTTIVQSRDNTKKTSQKCSYCDWYTVFFNYCSDLLIIIIIVQGLTNLENDEIKKKKRSKVNTCNLARGTCILQNGYEIFALIKQKHKIIHKD